MFCKHNWKKISETVTKSQFEVAMETVSPVAAGNVKIPHQMSNADRKHIQVYTCEKCGKLKRFVEDI